MSAPTSITPNIPPRFGTLKWYVFGLLIFLLGGVATLVLKRQMGGTDAYELERAKKRVEARQKIETEAKELLTKSGWADQGKGIVRIPLEDAMALELAALKQQKPRPAAYAVGAAVPVPASATAAPAPAPKADASKPATPAAPAPAAKGTPAATPAPAPAATPAAQPTTPK
ncbi:MAG: hypothetical protein B9S32_12100 [Verrucomicrobia bacterium Tous-C9LFEB]|nr:MAG: hypothetical protein B9S32_12100 [Verrucomicrobia bacterium Tous-C9LFEB]